MKFTCEKTKLVAAVSAAGRTAATKSSIPALEGIHVKAGNVLYITGFNLEIGVTVQVEADIQAQGTCVMPTRLFTDIIRKLPEDTLTISVDEKFQVSIRAGQSSFTITAMDAEDYPELPDVSYTNGIRIPQQALGELIGGTIFAVSENQARPIHTGCLVEVEDHSISMIAVDGYRLARRTFHPEAPTGRTLKFVVPGAALREVQKLLGSDDGDAIFTLGPKHILFEIGNATLVCRLLEGDFLDWRRVMPTNFPIQLVANISTLAASIERVSLIVSEKFKSPVRCLFGENRAEFKTVTTMGAAQDACPLAGNGGELEVGFNCKYLLDALRVCPGEEVTLNLRDGLSSIIFTPTRENDDFAYMVLPVRLKN